MEHIAVPRFVLWAFYGWESVELFVLWESESVSPESSGFIEIHCI